MWSWISSWLHKNMPSTWLMLLHLQFCYTRYIWEYFLNVVLFKNSKTQINILFIFYLKYLETGYPVGICVLSINMKILDLIKVQFWRSDPFTFFLWLLTSEQDIVFRWFYTFVIYTFVHLYIKRQLKAAHFVCWNFYVI